MLGFPMPYGDELLYSTVARHGVHSGIVSPKELLLEVFGDTKIIATVDLPNHLGTIADLYPEAVGIQPTTLLYQHTLFPIYAPFLGETRRAELSSQLIGGRKSSVHLKAGIVTSRVKQPECLRYCPGCMTKQLEIHGERYWQRVWQVAGVESCPEHGRLTSSSVPRHSEHRHLFQAADGDNCPPAEQSPGTWQSNLMASTIHDLLNISQCPALYPHHWINWYRHLAISNGLTRGRQVRHDLISEKVLEFWGDEWLSRYSLKPSDTESYWLRAIFRKHRKSFSYLEHMAVLHALQKPDWDLAETMRAAVYLQPELATSVTPVVRVEAEQSEPYRYQWRKAVSKCGAKEARKRNGKIYAWLYRHDRGWLLTQNQAHRRPFSRFGARIDWHQRDMQMLRVLRGIRDRHEVDLSGPRRSKNWYLNQLQGRAKIEKHLDLLPLCRQFLVRYSEKIFEYQIRRLTGTVTEAPVGKELKRWQVLRWSGLSEERLSELARRFATEILRI